MTLGRNEHNHPGQEGALLAAKITTRAKKDALDDLFKPSMVIVNQVLMEEMTDAPCPSLPKPLNLAKAANYLRQRLRPSDPTDLNFEIDSNHIPEGFMRGDIKVQLNLDYPDSLGPHEIVRIIEGPDNRKYEYL